MKTYLVTFVLLAAAFIACKSQKAASGPVSGNSQTVASATSDTVRIANDSLEYEVIIIDAGFNSWLATRARQRGFYSQQYLENKNRFWVAEWNIRANQSTRYRDMYQMQINYSPSIDYGYEVNYLLYNYLVYFQQTTGQRLGGIVPQY